MSTEQSWPIRVLIDGSSALRQYMASTPASAIPDDVLITLARIERQLRPVQDVFNARRAALAKEYEVVVDQQLGAYVPGEGDDAQARFDEFQNRVTSFLETPYRIEIEPLSAQQRKLLPNLSVLHLSLMPFLAYGL